MLAMLGGCVGVNRSRGGDGTLIVAVVNLKGGVGKSTSAVYFATVASEGGEVVVPDADTERSALGWAAAGKAPFGGGPAGEERLARPAGGLGGKGGGGGQGARG